MSGLDYEEKRRFMRLKISSVVHFRVQGDGIFSQGQAINISATGLKLSTHLLLTQGDIITLLIETPHPQLNNFMAKAIVINSLIATHFPAKQQVSLNFIQSQ